MSIPELFAAKVQFDQTSCFSDVEMIYVRASVFTYDRLYSVTLRGSL
jgi:hypothetical protein